MKHLISSLVLVFALLSLNAQDARMDVRSGQAPFFHGVASGDPLSDRVMIWTRVTPPTGDTSDVDVYWQIATDLNFSNVVNFGKTTASESSDYTVKLDVCGLQPGTYYYYVFRAYNTNSVIGRTKTAPVGPTAEARFAVASCSSYEHGYFNAYESMSKRNDLDAVIHLGDYIYEYETGSFSSTVVTGQGRVYAPSNEIVSLDDYRVRHSHYKLDYQLQRVHQIHPFITTWDDHETANDSYKDGAQNHDSATEGSWTDRKISGTQAYAEWMPIRNPDPNDNVKIWRSLQYGNLLDLIVLDSRLWARDEQDLFATNDQNRDLLGDDQFLWLEQNLADTSTQWKVVCQQVMMAPLELFGLAVNADQWDGYNKDRDRLINFIEANNVSNTVILTGDIHTSWINNVPGNSLTTAAVEFVVTSVTSPGLDVIEVALGQIPQAILDLFGGAVEGVVQAFNPHMQYVNIEDHGYMVLTVNNNRAQSDYIFLERESIDSTETVGTSYYTASGNSNVVPAANAFTDNGTAPVPSVLADQTIPFAILMDTMYFAATESQVLNDCLVDASNVCPARTSTILTQSVYGQTTMNDLCFTYAPEALYNGTDQFLIVSCTNTAPVTCDTILVVLEVEAIDDIDTVTYIIDADSIVSDCLSFNDLFTEAAGYSFAYGGSNSFSLGTGGCFTFSADSSFSGVEFAQVVACDSVGICDTVILEFIVSGVSATQLVVIDGESGELLSYCLDFDDLSGSLINSDIIYNAVNGNALIYNDTCISYISNSGFDGSDTLLFWGCDNGFPESCDTIMYVFNITNPDTVSSVFDLMNNEDQDFAVFGVYPNPFNSELLIQYYLFESQRTYIQLYDYKGSLIHDQVITDVSTGLQYAQLRTTEIPRGVYVLRISTDSQSYTKKVEKL